MPWNGSGVFARVYSWVADANAGLDILADRMDQDTDDIAQGLMHCLTVNGETVPTANLPMANYRHTGVSAGVADTDYCTVGQIKNGGGGLPSGGYLALAGGTMSGNLIISRSVPCLSLMNTGGAPARFGMWCASNVLGFGAVDASGNPVNPDLMALNAAGQLILYQAGIIVGGDVQLSNALVSTAAGGVFTISGSPTVSGVLTVNGNLTVHGALAAPAGISGNLSVGGGLTVGATITAANATITNTATVGTLVANSEGRFGASVYPVVDNRDSCGRPGNAWFACEAYNFVTASDLHLKTDLAPLDADCIELVRRIAPQRFRWVEGRDSGRHWGFVAQDVAVAMAAAGHEFGGHLVDPDSGRERLAYNELVAVLWRAVQQLAQHLDAMSTPSEPPPSGLLAGA
ncbi:MAG TPA: tail fiber domain-containing protein [Stellaceae bacterium]|jgi:hypothetical protein